MTTLIIHFPPFQTILVFENNNAIFVCWAMNYLRMDVFLNLPKIELILKMMQ